MVYIINFNNKRFWNPVKPFMTHKRILIDDKIVIESKYENNIISKGKYSVLYML